MVGFGSLATVTGLKEVNENVEVLKDWVSDLSASASRHNDSIEKLKNLPSITTTICGSITKMETKIDTQNALLVDSLKV